MVNLLFKAKLRGYHEPVASTEFALNEIKKEFSPEVRALFDRKIPEHFVDNLEEVVTQSQTWQESLRQSPSFEDSLEITPVKLNRYGTPKKVSGKPKPDYDRIIVLINKYRDTFTDLLLDKNAVENIIGQNISIEVVPKSLKELVLAYKDDNRIFDKLKSAVKTFDRLEQQMISEKSKKVRSKSKPKSESFTSQLKKLIIQYSEDSRQENMKGLIDNLDRDYKFFNQNRISTFYTRYDKGELPQGILEILNDEYDGQKGAEILAKLLQKLKLSTHYASELNLDRLKAYEKRPLSQAIQVLDEVMQEDSTVEENQIMLDADFDKIEDFADKIDDRIMDLLEGADAEYHLVPSDDGDDFTETNEESRQIELKKSIKYYAFLYYVAKLNNKQLDKSILNIEEYEINENDLPELFPVLTDVHNREEEE
jgi:hypothetical protein